MKTDMDIRELNLFLHLAASLHFGQTSRACNITRSGLTRTIQRIEQELGETLFHRDNRSVNLTKAGERFREYAADVVQRYRALKTQLASESSLHGELTLYCSVTAILSILPGIISRFRRRYPEIHLKLSTGDAAMALHRLENNEADITIAALPDRLPKPIMFVELLETPLIFIAPKDSEPVGLADLSDNWEQIPVVMPERGLSRDRCVKWFADKKITPTIYSSVAGNEALLAMVAMGCGIGVVPLLVLENSPLKSRIRILDVEPALAPFQVGACTTSANSRWPVVQAFWNVIKEETTYQLDQVEDENYSDHQ